MILPVRQTDTTGRSVYTEIHMGVPVRVTLFSKDSDSRKETARGIFSQFASLEDIFSDWRPTSETSKLCARPGEWIPVSPPMWELLEVCHRMVEASDGLFDPTVGPLVTLWRESRSQRRLPEPKQLADARARTGWHQVERDAKGHRVRVAAGTRLDFGGIAKGYAVARAWQEATRTNRMPVLIEAGGDLVCGDPPPGRPAWRIALPDGRRRDLSRQHVSTSGDDYQGVEINGRRYAHIVDPRTGLGATNLHRASVCGPDGAIVDAVATAACLMSQDDAKRLARSFAKTELL